MPTQRKHGGAKRCSLSLDWEGVRKCVYNNAIYSADHGKTWQASTCVQLATGEGTLIERADGGILYNPRAETRRNMAAYVSLDSGRTWREAKTFCVGPAAYSSLVFNPVDQHLSSL